MPTPSAGAGATTGAKRPRMDINNIANKMKRSEVLAKFKADNKKAKKERRKTRDMLAAELGDAAPPKQVPRTLENSREVDDTIVTPDDEEVLRDEVDDEFAPYYNCEKTAKVMITTQQSPSGKIYRLIAEFMAIIPNCHFYKRRKYTLAKICKWATEMGYTHLLVLTEKYKIPNGLFVIHLPFGPTCNFRLTSSMLTHEIKGHGNVTGHYPEIILNNFITRLGRRVGRMIGSLFPKQPEYTGRRVCTFHNQRDFIFFRQHRYIFKEDGSGVRLQELGPRFTLKLKWVMAGIFEKHVLPRFEWYLKRHEMETSKRKFML